MWARKLADNTLYFGDTGEPMTSIGVNQTAFSAPMRVLGAKSVSFVFRGASGGPLASAVVMISNAESPNALGDSTDWVVAGTAGTGLGYSSATATAANAFVNYGGLQFTCYPLSSDTTPAPDSCITARWARLRLVNSSTAIIPTTHTDVVVLFEGDLLPQVVSGVGYTTRSVMTEYSGSAAKNEKYIISTGCGATLKDGSLVAYTDGLPVVAGSLYTANVTANYYRLVTKPGSTAYLTNPSTYSNKGITIYNLALVADSNRL